MSFVEAPDLMREG